MPCLVKLPRSRNWYLVFWREGRQVWRSTGTPDRGLAERALAELRAVLAGQAAEARIAGLLREAGMPAAPEASVPVASLERLWAAAPKPRRARADTERAKAAEIRRFVAWLAARHPEVAGLHEVSPAMAAGYLDAQGGGGQTRNNRLSRLRSVWEVILVPARLERSPWGGIPRVERRGTRYRAMSLQEVGRLLASARSLDGRSRLPGFWPAAVAVGYATGLRFGDICTLEAGHVNRDAGMIRRVPRKAWKQAKVVVAPLPGWVAEMLPAPAEGLLWPAAADAYARRAAWLYGEMRRVWHGAGLKSQGESRDSGFHSLRATYVTLLQEAGLDLDAIRGLVGHGSTGMTLQYSRDGAAAARRARELVPRIG